MTFFPIIPGTDCEDYIYYSYGICRLFCLKTFCASDGESQFLKLNILQSMYSSHHGDKVWTFIVLLKSQFFLKIVNYPSFLKKNFWTMRCQAYPQQRTDPLLAPSVWSVNPERCVLSLYICITMQQHFTFPITHSIHTHSIHTL